MSEQTGAVSSKSGLLARDWAMIAGCAFVAFTLLVVRPFGDATSEPAKDLATAWNESIAQLGISPVFPPEEDLYVGDIFAVISGSSKQPLLGRAVRIGHIDLHSDMIEEALARPLFADTEEMKAADEYRHQDDAERSPAVDDKRIHLTLAAFPGISISHLAHAGSAAGTSFFGVGAARDSTAVEELRIPVAETYGVAASRAGGRLREWCLDQSHALFCTDTFARHVLAYTVDPDVLRPAGKTFLTKIELEIVIRVFMTRAIEQRRLQASARGLEATGRKTMAQASPPTSDQSVTPESKARDAVSAVQQTNATNASGGAPSAEVSSGDLQEIRLQQTFQRPVGAVGVTTKQSGCGGSQPAMAWRLSALLDCWATVVVAKIRENIHRPKTRTIMAIPLVRAEYSTSGSQRPSPFGVRDHGIVVNGFQALPKIKSSEGSFK